MFGVLIIYPHSPSGTAHHQESCMYVTGPTKFDHLSTKITEFFIFALTSITIYATATKSSLLQNLMGFLLQLTEM